jgi:iron complex outermembrane recepter protein
LLHLIVACSSIVKDLSDKVPSFGDVNVRHTRAFRCRIYGLLFLGVVLDAVAQQQPAPSPQQDALTEIVVTAQKRTESLVQVPISVTAFSEKTLEDYNVQDFTDYATKVPNLDFSVGQNAQPGLEISREVAIRGMSGTGTTSLYIDDTPLPDTLDPAVVDFERIEVLKGPQGTLFGESSMGGNIRMISHAPSLTDNDFKYMLQSGWTQYGTEPDYGGNIVGNIVVVPGVFGIRAMGLANYDSGYITRTYPCTPGSVDRCDTHGIGSHEKFGGSISGLLQVSERFSIDMKLLGQISRYPNGFPVVFAEPPSYRLSLTDNRLANEPEKSDFHWYMPAVTFRYQGNGWNATSASAYFASHQAFTENSVEGVQYFSQTALGFTPGLNIPLVPAVSDMEQFAQEVRVAFEPIYNLSGIGGAFYRNLRDNFHTSATVPGLQAATGLSDLLYNVILETPQTDKSVFGELYYKMFGKVTATLGVRKYWLTDAYNTVPLGGFIFTPTAVSVAQTGISPKYGLKYEISPDSMVYTSAAKGFRPGGGNLQPPPECDPQLASLGIPRANTLGYKSDDVWSYELGGKSKFADGKVLLTAAVFDIEWKNIQQAINLASCGSVFTANSGAARNRGGELELSANPTSVLSLRAGLGYVNAVIIQPGPGSPLYAGEPVFNVPKVTANVGGIYTVRQWQDKEWLVTTDASYVGSNYSGNTSATTPIERPGFYVWNASTSLNWGKERRQLTLYFKNLTNARAFYGDLQPLTFGAETVLNGVTYPIARAQVSPPLQIGLQFRQGF